MGRSLKKGPFCDDHLMKKVEELNKANKKGRHQNVVAPFHDLSPVCRTYVCGL